MKNTVSLKGSVNFKRTLKQGKYVSGNIFTIYSKKNNSKINHLGICVSKKHGNSVVRNRLKRWVRESYKELEENISLGYNIVVLYKKNIEIKNINYNSVKDEIKDLFIKNGLYVK